MRAFLVPAFQMAAESGPRAPKFMQLVGRMYSETSDQYRGTFLKLYLQMGARFTSALAQSLPHLEADEVMWRLHFLVGSLAHTMVWQECCHDVMGLPVKDHGELMEALTRFAVGGMTASGDPSKASAPKAYHQIFTSSSSWCHTTSVAEQRSVGSTELANRWREAIGVIPDAVEVQVNASMFSAGDAIYVQMTGADIEQLRAAATMLKERLAEYAGVYDIADSFREGKQELELGIKPAAETLGLTLQDMARQVRQAFYGEEAQRIQRGRDDVRVMVRYPHSARCSLGDLEGMRIRTPDGQEVPFS